MVQTLPGDLFDVQGEKNTSSDKEIRNNLWWAPSWAMDDPKKGNNLSLKEHDPTIAKQYIRVMWSTKNRSWQKNPGLTLYQLTTKLPQKRP